MGIHAYQLQRITVYTKDGRRMIQEWNREKKLEVLGREIFTFVSVTTWGYSPAINE